MTTELIPPPAGDPVVKARRRPLVVFGVVAVVAIGAAALLVPRMLARRRHAEAEREIARQVDESGRQAATARAKAAEARDLRSRAFAAFDTVAMDRGSGEALWRQSRTTIGDADAAYNRAVTALDAALTLDPARSALRGQLGDLLLQHILFAEEVRLDGKAPSLVPRLTAADLDGSRRKTLAAEAVLDVETHPAGWDSKMVLERYDRDPASGHRVLKRVAGLDASISLSPLPAGSYRLTFDNKDCAHVIYPVEVRRGERVTVKAWLPPASAVPAGFVYVPPGPFWFGEADEKLRTDSLGTVPLHRRNTEGYLIARNETTFGEWIQFLESAPPRQQEGGLPQASVTKPASPRLRKVGKVWELSLQPTTTGYSARAGESITYVGRATNQRQDWRRFPVAGVSLADAGRYVGWLNKTGKVRGARLCTEAEWERAARGADDRLFPHGDQLAPPDANIHLTYGPVDSAFGPDAVGTHPQSRSPFELDDLVGNASELTISSLKPDELVLRGGSYFSQLKDSRVTRREVVPATYRDTMVGIRVCATLKESGEL